MYTPDNWIIVKLDTGSEVFYKILGGWSGGYLDGDSWRMNSGITKVTEDGDHYLFGGYSGSVYKCHKDSETLRMNNAYVFEKMQKQDKVKVTRISYEDFVKEFNAL